MKPDDPLGMDAQTVVSNRPGMNVLCYDNFYEDRVEQTARIEAAVSFSFLFSGKGQGWLVGADGQKSETVTFNPGRLYFSLLPKAISGVRIVPGKMHVRCLYIRLSLEVWRSISAGFDLSVLGTKHPFCLTTSGLCQIFHLPVSEPLRKIIFELFRLACSGEDDLNLESCLLPSAIFAQCLSKY